MRGTRSKYCRGSAAINVKCLDISDRGMHPKSNTHADKGSVTLKSRL
jgi:hypothetical protein